MKKTHQIKIGNELFINRIGVLISVLGIGIGLIFIAVLFFGTHLPLEMKLIYYVELIGRNFYISFLVSILTVIIGIKISDLRHYSSANLILEKDKISFAKNGELVELPKWKIKKISKRKSLIFDSKRIKIKTVTSKEYDFKGEENVFNELEELFPFKIKRNKKTLGNNV